ncbi:hypothetical protein AXG93_2338s1010 [Marchantia polymorpha subsp. ruderalis]|uniref:Uncharacterized protein n=1 Tax=Marchantia polymorpha subsp. ruderalis TaxID=1480154 RepID=A0A176VIX3_MARPO|nr:hypothetical protein AXG93_2338s1010 [Marchantia polymorpha subsp. ruderalis]
MDDVIEKVIEDVDGAACGPQKVVPLEHSPGQSYWRRVKILWQKSHSHKHSTLPTFYVCRMEACRTAYNTKLLKVDELTATSEKEQEYETKLAAMAKKLRMVKTHKWLRLRELEHPTAEMIAWSVRRQRRLAKKLDAFITRSRDAVLNLELELAAVLQRLGLE